MISKNKIKQIKSLSQKKSRSKNKLFLVEGNKLVTEVIHSEIEIEYLIGTKDFLSSFKSEELELNELIEASQEEINKASLLQNPQQSIAVCRIPNQDFNINSLTGRLTLCLDTVQDPGNLGTIIRIADWFGVETIIASPETADLFNPKVIQATMGAFCRVQVIYTDLNSLFREIKTLNLPVFGAFMDGENIFNEELPYEGVIVMGNEGNGISKGLEPFINHKLHIPGYKTSESLNVSVATAIICSEFRRQVLSGK